MVNIENVQKNIIHTALNAMTLDDHDPQGGDGDIDLGGGEQYCLLEVVLMPHTRHTLRMGDKLTYTVSSWAMSGPYISVHKAAPTSSNYNFAVRHGYGRRGNIRTIGYMKRRGYELITQMQPGTNRYGLRTGLSSHHKVELYWIGEWIPGPPAWIQGFVDLYPTRQKNHRNSAWVLAVV